MFSFVSAVAVLKAGDYRGYLSVEVLPFPDGNSRSRVHRDAGGDLEKIR